MKKILILIGLVSFATAIEFKTYAGVGLGASFDNIKANFVFGEAGIKEDTQENYPFYEINVGEEITFDNYNGLQVYASGGVWQKLKYQSNLNKGDLLIGINYVLEPKKLSDWGGGINFALISGFDMGVKFSGLYNKEEITPTAVGVIQTQDSEGMDNQGIHTSFVMDYNLGFRVRYKNYALLWNTRFPLYKTSTPAEANLYMTSVKYAIPGRFTIGKADVSSYPIITTLSFMYFF